MPEPKISVIIPAYNAEKTIRRALEAVMKQDVSEPFEVIVVDDGSQDATAQIVRAFPSVVYIHQPNAGSAAARNRGAAAARGEVFLFTDSDCVPHPDWVRLMTAAFRDGGAGAVAGSYGIANPQSRLAAVIHDEIMYRHKQLMPDEPKVLGSYNFAVLRHVFQNIDGFDEGYRTASGEDNDLSYRLIGAGYKIVFARNALVDHHHPESMKRYLYEQYRHGFWRAKMYREHPQMSQGDDYTFWKDVVEIPLAGMASLLIVLSVFSGPGFVAAFLILIFILSLLEIFFSFNITRGLSRVAVLSVMMTLRAFARTFGFVTGTIKPFFAPEFWGLAEKQKP